MNAQVEVKFRREEWRVVPFASAQNVGIICGEGCGSASAIGIGAERRVGWVWLGAGVAGLSWLDEWRIEPYAAISIETHHLQVQLRARRPHGLRGTYVPLLLGLRLP